MPIYGITSWNQIGDTLILTAAARNVRLVHPGIKFVYTGPERYLPLLEGNGDFVREPVSRKLDTICYGPGEHQVKRGNHVQAQTMTLCERLKVDMAPVACTVPVVRLTSAETAWSAQWGGTWLVNANCQTCSVSKGYPHWQAVVDILGKEGYRLVQIGGREDRDISVDLKGVEDMRGRTTLREWLAMVHGCAGILTPPSGVLHAGAIWRKPMVCLSGAREAVGLTDYPTAFYCVTRCRDFGCEAMEPKDCCRYDGRWCGCMSDIAPESVVEAVHVVDGAR